MSVVVVFTGTVLQPELHKCPLSLISMDEGVVQTFATVYCSKVLGNFVWDWCQDSQLVCCTSQGEQSNLTDPTHNIL